jgi:hypothetical protein
VIATLWLCCQAGSMSLSAAIIGMLPFGDQALQQCTCVHAAGDSAMCPMHHTPAHATLPPPADPMLAGHMHMHGSRAADHDHSGGRQAAQPATPADADRHRTCHMRSADPGSTVALVTIVGPLGLLAAAHVSLLPTIPTSHRGCTQAAAVDRVLPPDPRPPRA